MELEYFEVYFLSLQNNGVFDISDHSISTLEILESHRTSVWVSFGGKKPHSSVCFRCLFSAYGMISFVQLKVRRSYLMTAAHFPVGAAA